MKFSTWKTILVWTFWKKDCQFTEPSDNFFVFFAVLFALEVSSIMLHLHQTTKTSIYKVQKQIQKQSQTIFKTTWHSGIFILLIWNKVAKITYFISKRQNVLRVKLYLKYFGVILFTFPLLTTLCCAELHSNLLIHQLFVFLAHA